MIAGMFAGLFRLLSAVFLISAGAAVGQSYPDYQDITVNDYADLLSATEESRLRARLSTLKRDTGVEMTVLTLPTQSAYAPEKSLEEFATGLFNHWGIGDATRNDGVLVMVLRDDRAMRIELGAAFGRNWDDVAQQVVDTKFLPWFRKDAYESGIMTGSNAVIDDIVTPFLAGSAPPDIKEPQNFSFWVVAAMVVSIFVMKGRQRLADLFARLRTCPQCGHRGLRASRSVLHKATRKTTGQGRRVLTCPKCGYTEDNTYTIARISSGSGGSFGGGRSGGGGASGRW